MNNNDQYRLLPNSSGHNCFACSPGNKSGLQMKFFADKDAVFSELTIPDHLGGWSNIAHGGVITTILDEIMSWAALHFLKRIIMTKTLTVEFIKPVYINNPLKAEGHVDAVVGKHEAVLEGMLFNSAGDICAKSMGNFSIFSASVARRLGIADDASLKFFGDIFGIK